MANIFTRIRDAGRKKKSSSPPAPTVRQTGKVVVTSKEAASVPASQRRVVSTATGTKTQVARQLTTRATRRSGGGGGSVTVAPRIAAAVKASSEKITQRSIDTKVQKRIGREAQSIYTNTIRRVANFNQLGGIARRDLLERAEKRALKYYNQQTKMYFSNPATRLPRPPPRIVDLNLNKQTIRGPLGKAWGGVLNILDAYSGGKLTNKKLDKLQNDLNKKSNQFNLKYENKSLPYDQSVAANALYAHLLATQKAIDLARKGSSKKLDDIIKQTSSAKRSSGKLTFGKILRATGLTGQSGFGSPFSKKSQAQSAGAAAAAASFIIGLTEIPGTIANIKKDPLGFLSNTKNLPAQIKDSIVKNVKIATVNPNFAVAKIATSAGIQYATFKITDKGLRYTGKIAENVAVRSIPGFKFRKTVFSPVGERKIVNVPKVGDIEVIRPRGSGLKVDPVKAVKEAALENQIKKAPVLAKTASNAENEIIKIVRKRGDVITGSYAQESLLKKAFTKIHKDIDILTTNRPKFLSSIKKALGGGVTFKKLKNSIEVRYKGKVIADVVEWSKGEAGFAKKYGWRKVRGVNLVRPQARLASKVYQLGKLGERII